MLCYIKQRHTHLEEGDVVLKIAICVDEKVFRDAAERLV